MAELSFPTGPSDGQVYAPNGVTSDYWVWNDTGGYWRLNKITLATIEGGYVQSINGVTGTVDFYDQQFEYNNNTDKFILNKDFFRESTTVNTGLLLRSPVLTETNRQGLLSSGTTSASSVAETVGNQQTTTSTTKILLVDGTPEEERYGNIGGITSTIISTRYYNGADITIYGYKYDNTGSTIRKFMILYNIDGATFGYTEYANLSMGSNIGTFTLEATGNSWGLFVTPASTDETIFSVRSTMYTGTNLVV
jgi:hypothetical protein